MATLSAKELGLRVDDNFINIRVPPIDRTGCDSDVDFLGLAISRRDNVGVFGPDDALNHTSWVPTGGVVRPNVAGAFAVTADGSLTLTLPSSYADRMNRVPLQTAPEGIPLVMLTRKANFYYPEDGVNEAVTCFLGWQNLEIPIIAPEATALTLITVHRHYSTNNDNHLTDSTRQTEFSYDYVETTLTHPVTVSAGTQTVIVQLVATVGHPLMDRVVSMQLSGFSNGSWVIGEPRLAKADPGRIILKAFEGYES